MECVTGPQAPGETMFNHVLGVGDELMMASYNLAEHIHLVGTAT